MLKIHAYFTCKICVVYSRRNTYNSPFLLVLKSHTVFWRFLAFHIKKNCFTGFSAITLPSTAVPTRESGQSSPNRECVKPKGRAKRFGARGEMWLSLSVTLSQSMIDNMLIITQLKRALAVRLYMSNAVPLLCPDTPLQKQVQNVQEPQGRPTQFSLLPPTL